jgi:hypothetical protein
MIKVLSWLGLSKTEIEKPKLNQPPDRGRYFVFLDECQTEPVDTEKFYVNIPVDVLTTEDLLAEKTRLFRNMGQSMAAGPTRLSAVMNELRIRRADSNPIIIGRTHINDHGRIYPRNPTAVEQQSAMFKTSGIEEWRD